MAKVTRIKVGYSRKLSDQDYGSVEWSGETELELEGTEVVEQVRQDEFEKLRQTAKEALQGFISEIPAQNTRRPVNRPEPPKTVGRKASGTPAGGTNRRVFSIDDIETARMALLDAGLVASGEELTNHDIRKWLIASPLKPGFLGELLATAVQIYLGYRHSGMKTAEAMDELHKDWEAVTSEETDGSGDAGRSEDNGEAGGEAAPQAGQPDTGY